MRCGLISKNPGIANRHKRDVKRFKSKTSSHRDRSSVFSREPRGEAIDAYVYMCVSVCVQALEVKDRPFRIRPGLRDRTALLL